ncbi:MAG: tetratricopeptide repeat protein [Anaerolineales bacterium]|jgi:tetratricopeptide (TPR) repeat protein|nr:tetratricopeptide repeat protein [Anaerolineales bacterium]
MFQENVKITDQTPFIGRAEVLSVIERSIKPGSIKKVVYINGGGGIGKTSLLKEVYRRYMDIHEVALVEIIDFDDGSFHVPGNIEQRIAQLLGRENFEEYWRKFKVLRILEQAGSDSTDQEELREEMRLAFIKNLDTFSRQKRVVVLLDTAEKQQSPQTWSHLLDILLNTSNVVALIAGRDIETLYENFTERMGKKFAELIPLKPLKPGESRQYLEEKQKSKHINLDAAIIRGLLKLSQGRPILLDLSVEWLSRDIPADWLLNIAKKKVKDADLAKYRDDFERGLVKSVTDIHNPMDRLCLLLSRVYPLDVEGIAELLRIDPREAQLLYQDAISYVFIKRMPDQSLSLHDEMRRMIEDYVWPEVVQSKERRIHESNLAAAYLIKKIRSISEKLEELEKDSREEKVIEIGSLERQKWSLQGMYLTHALFANAELGISEFIRLFDENKSNNPREVLVNAIDSYDGKISDQSMHEVIIRQAEFFNDKGEFEKALELSEKLSLDVSPEMQLDVLTKRAKSKMNSGKLPEAERDFRESLNICASHPDLAQWKGTILNSLGLTLRLMGRHPDAADCYQKALTALKSSKNLAKTASALNNLGYVQSLDGRYSSAMTYCQEAVKIRLGLDDIQDIGSSYCTIGEVYRNWGKYQEALEYYNKALKIFEPEDSLFWLARLYSYRGAVYRLMDDLDQAERDLKRSLAFNIVIEKGWATHVLGCVYQNRGKLDEALACFEESRESSTLTFDVRTQVNNIISSAEVNYTKWMESGKQDERWVENIANLDKTLRDLLSEDYNFPHHLGRMQKILGDVAFEQGRFEDARQIYADAFPALTLRKGGYGQRTFLAELDVLNERIDTLANKNKEQAIEWCNWLGKYWSDEDRPILRRDDLVSLCSVRLIELEMRS